MIKTARGEDQGEAKEMLGLVTVEIFERGSRAEARARYPGGRGERRNVNVSVAYNVTAPPGTRVTAKSISGDVDVADIRGELALESVSGTITVKGAGRIASAKSVSGGVRIHGAQMDGSFHASSVSGRVELDGVKARRIELGSVSGPVVLKGVEAERVDAQSVSGQVDFSGALARGGRYALKSHSGTVRVAVEGDRGFEVDASSFSGSVRSDFPLTVRAGEETSHMRRAVRGVHGDGSAMLELTTFSGNIVLSRR